jgi:hypothetical protein
MYPLFLVMLVVAAQASPAVTVSTDRGWYSPGDQVSIYISTTGFASSEQLSLYVDKPDGHNLYFTELDSRGGTIDVMLPQDAADGTYTITVTWDHRYVETGFVVESQPIPEFPLTSLVLLVAFATAFAAILGRKTSVSAKAATVDPDAHVLR